MHFAQLSMTTEALVAGFGDHVSRFFMTVMLGLLWLNLRAKFKTASFLSFLFSLQYQNTVALVELEIK